MVNLNEGDSLAIPPKEVVPATIEDIKKIYEDTVNPVESLLFHIWF